MSRSLAGRDLPFTLGMLNVLPGYRSSAVDARRIKADVATVQGVYGVVVGPDIDRPFVAACLEPLGSLTQGLFHVGTHHFEALPRLTFSQVPQDPRRKHDDVIVTLTQPLGNGTYSARHNTLAGRPSSLAAAPVPARPAVERNDRTKADTRPRWPVRFPRGRWHGSDVTRTRAGGHISEGDGRDPPVGWLDARPVPPIGGDTGWSYRSLPRFTPGLCATIGHAIDPGRPCGQVEG